MSLLDRKLGTFTYTAIESVFLNYLNSALQDESISQEGDLYIRSVCFSPDGRFLATGDEDKLIRVQYGYALQVLEY